jgi:TIR domain
VNDSFHYGDNIRINGDHAIGKIVNGGSGAPRSAGQARTNVVWGDPFVFVNYRSTDEKAAADLDAELTNQLGTGAVFRDAWMRAGTEFPQELARRAATCRVMISIIGRRWDDADGLRLLKDPKDWVRREIAAALTHDVQVVPVMVGVRDRLAADVLPKDIRKIAFLQGPHLPSGYDVDHVRQLVEKLVREVPALWKAQNRC